MYDSAIEAFFHYVDTHRKPTYIELNKLADKYGVKVESFLRRTRANDPRYKGTLKFRKIDFRGKKVRPGVGFHRLIVTGTYRSPTVFNK